VTNALGRHVLLEFYGCPPGTLTSTDYVEDVLVGAARVSNAHIVNHLFHQFLPYGVSGVVVIEESHYTIHTWPEHGYAAIDLFTCSDDVDIEAAIQYLKDHFRPSRIEKVKVDRGVNFKLEAV